MKIVIVGPAYPYRGGIAALNERLAIQLCRENHDVAIYTFTLQYPSILFPGTTQYATGEAPKEITILRRINSCNPLNWIKVGREIKNLGADIVIFRFWLPFMAPCLGSISRIVRKNHKSRTIALVDNIIPHEKRFFDRSLASWFVKSVDGFIAMSKSVLDDLARFDKKKPKHFSPHPIYDIYGERVSRDEAARYLNLDSKCRYMLFFGLIRDYKGLDWLLRAFAKSELYKQNVKLIVAGEFYSHPEEYFELENELNLKGSVKWYSKFVPDDEVRYYFSMADIVVQPYKSATQSGITQVAYHFEKPMLVTNVGGLAEIVPHGKVGYTVEPEIDSISTALEDFFKNRRGDNFHEGILAEKEKYSWNRMTETIYRLK